MGHEGQNMCDDPPVTKVVTPARRGARGIWGVCASQEHGEGAKRRGPREGDGGVVVGWGGAYSFWILLSFATSASLVAKASLCGSSSSALRICEAQAKE